MSAVADIERVVIVDDQPESRKSYGYTVENADFEPVPEEGPLGTLEQYFAHHRIQDVADAALCDYQLSARAYASFTGAELVAIWYKSNFPAVLCTRWEKTQIERIRPLRRWIPVLIRPDELNVDTLVHGLEECIRELQGEFGASRRPWRTQVHFLTPDDEQAETFFAEIPGWENREVIRVRLSDLPENVATLVKENFRCHAYANLGAETTEDLYLCDWMLVTGVAQLLRTANTRPSLTRALAHRYLSTCSKSTSKSLTLSCSLTRTKIISVG
jgi:hypothetical protein